ncbi:hypothetical protein COV18_02775 [Candidatus Woesearchaeota archaeon CG10_big_fil_rev_8_21_14_0_10_37_12]|nr:MAG: hypothetical protein COV18_02775 [Candidatus Woesearchaeota archaeon CG10_big_fil_rev_8_21_14_0_10_37_12]
MGLRNQLEITIQRANELIKQYTAEEQSPEYDIKLKAATYSAKQALDELDNYETTQHRTEKTKKRFSRFKQFIDEEKEKLESSYPDIRAEQIAARGRLIAEWNDKNKAALDELLSVQSPDFQTRYQRAEQTGQAHLQTLEQIITKRRKRKTHEKRGSTSSLPSPKSLCLNDRLDFAILNAYAEKQRLAQTREDAFYSNIVNKIIEDAETGSEILKRMRAAEEKFARVEEHRGIQRKLEKRIAQKKCEIAQYADLAESTREKLSRWQLHNKELETKVNNFNAKYHEKIRAAVLEGEDYDLNETYMRDCQRAQQIVQNLEAYVRNIHSNQELRKTFWKTIDWLRKHLFYATAVAICEIATLGYSYYAPNVAQKQETTQQVMSELFRSHHDLRYAVSTKNRTHFATFNTFSIQPRSEAIEPFKIDIEYDSSTGESARIIINRLWDGIKSDHSGKKFTEIDEANFLKDLVNHGVQLGIKTELGYYASWTGRWNTLRLQDKDASIGLITIEGAKAYRGAYISGK